jgi:hypothetical protein
MAFAGRTVAESAGLNHRLLRRSRIYGSNSRDKTVEVELVHSAFLAVPYEAIAVRPLPCNYNVIQSDSTLSRR